jgi:hypothetical protein
MINEKILTLRDILKFCARRSGRTTEILNFINSRLRDDCEETDKHYVVITCNQQMLQYYVKELKFFYLNCLGFDGRRIFLNNKTNNKVTFISGTEEIQSALAGLRVDDVIFDTPEQNVFNLEIVDKKLFYLISRLK